MARYKTLVDNPWSKKDEIVEKDLIGRVVGYEPYTDLLIQASDYPSIWQPIEEEEKNVLFLYQVVGFLEGLSVELDSRRKSVARGMAEDLRKTADSLTQRVKELENRKDL